MQPVSLGLLQKSMKAALLLAVSTLALTGCSSVPGDAAYRAGQASQAAKLYEIEYRRNGSNAAGLRYAQMLFAGDGIPKDEAKAISIWRELAEVGEPLAYHNLGVAYETGAGVEQDHRKAEEFYRMAADTGYLFSIFNLGTMYSNQLTHEPDDVQGLSLLLKAQRLATGNTANERWIREDKFGEPVGHVAKMRARMSATQIKEAEELAK